MEEQSDMQPVEVNLEGMRLLIATHTHGTVTPAYAHSIWRLGVELAMLGVPHDFIAYEDSLVDRGRDRAAATVLENPEITHLLFIDADIEFQPDDAIKLMAADKALVVGGYRKKNDRDEFAISFLEGADKALEVDEKARAVKIARAGTGFMLIKREVFERLADARPDLAYVDQVAGGEKRVMRAFFEHVVRGGRRWSEDFTFCERWREIGGDVWIVPEINLGHWGPAVWRGAVIDQLLPADEEGRAA